MSDLPVVDLDQYSNNLKKIVKHQTDPYAKVMKK